MYIWMGSMYSMIAIYHLCVLLYLTCIRCVYMCASVSIGSSIMVCECSTDSSSGWGNETEVSISGTLLYTDNNINMYSDKNKGAGMGAVVCRCRRSSKNDSNGVDDEGGGMSGTIWWSRGGCRGEGVYILCTSTTSCRVLLYTIKAILLYTISAYYYHLAAILLYIMGLGTMGLSILCATHYPLTWCSQQWTKSGLNQNSEKNQLLETSPNLASRAKKDCWIVQNRQFLVFVHFGKSIQKVPSHKRLVKDPSPQSPVLSWTVQSSIGQQADGSMSRGSETAKAPDGFGLLSLRSQRLFVRIMELQFGKTIGTAIPFRGGMHDLIRSISAKSHSIHFISITTDSTTVILLPSFRQCLFLHVALLLYDLITSVNMKSLVQMHVTIRIIDLPYDVYVTLQLAVTLSILNQITKVKLIYAGLVRHKQLVQLIC